ncbi:PH domain-containing protein [Herbivorax sp. ANBcel31]|uniref:PH domain-containing protein n=1 Tax=Herbivorax sp. ANBcel31 TaxID=3069754 RepID=UPI0027B1EBF7|nr:PH domain-containing protein [Herbivorax sp. ANBcel31]MDQ2085387.1 PH domain-containing protein [Herbivorax sp. ANBcel31]
MRAKHKKGDDMEFKKPSEKMDPIAKRAWILSGCVSFVVYITITIVFYILNDLYFSLPNFITWILLGMSITLGVLEILIVPSIRMYHWCYEIKETEVDIQNGIIVIKRTLIPTARIQHVDTEQGPILRFFKLATLSISTAGSVHKIPAIKMEKALFLRSKISELAKVSDDDV